jgi:hypothetical protein
VEYQYLPIPEEITTGTAGSKRARSPDDFERATDMALLYDDLVEADELEAWLSARVFTLDKKETIPQYWLRQRKLSSVYRLA